jgi:FixJ family two-component response regulator
MPEVNDGTVFVVDDDVSVRHGVARLLRAAGYSAKTFSSPGQFLKQPLPAGPACLVLDVCMDGLNGLEVQQALRGNPRNLPIVFLSGQADVPIATKAMKGGADDFLEKPFRPEALIGAVGHAIDRDRKASAARADHDEVVRRHETLTAREQEVMALVVQGLLNKQVAAELGISEKTVKVHRGRAMEKMQVESLAELVRLAERVEPHAPPELAGTAVATTAAY